MSVGHSEMQIGTPAPDLANMSAAQAVRFGLELCRALLDAETERGFHGALYPANLTYTEDGRIRLGEALTLDGEYSPDELEYLAPELFWNGKGGPATDVYAVGLLLYAACSGGRPAFTGERGELSGDVRAAAATRRLKGEALDVPKNAGGELAEVILRATAYREEERWPDIESLRCALEDCHDFAAPVIKQPQPVAAPAAVAAPPAAAKPVQKAAAPAPKRKKDAKDAVPDGYPRPVYDVFNEKQKKKKRSPLPALATILALVVIFLAVMYFVKGGEEPDTQDPTPPVVDPSPSVEQTPAPVQTPDANPDETTEPEPDTTPEPDPEPDESFTVTPLEVGSASWAEAAAMCTAQGGHLPVVRNQEDLNALISAAQAKGISYVWLDAKRGTDGVWRTSAGEEITFFRWFTGEPSGTDTDGTAENYLMLWKYNGVWGYNDMRSDPGTTYVRYYGGKIAVFCQND